MVIMELMNQWIINIMSTSSGDGGGGGGGGSSGSGSSCSHLNKKEKAHFNCKLD